MIVKLLTEHYLEFLSLKGGCRGSSESTLVNMSNCWKSHALAQLKKVVCPSLVPETFIPKLAGNKNISILHLSCRMSDLKFSLVLQTLALVL